MQKMRIKHTFQLENDTLLLLQKRFFYFYCKKMKCNLLWMDSVYGIASNGRTSSLVIHFVAAFLQFQLYLEIDRHLCVYSLHERWHKMRLSWSFQFHESSQIFAYSFIQTSTKRKLWRWNVQQSVRQCVILSSRFAFVPVCLAAWNSNWMFNQW